MYLYILYLYPPQGCCFILPGLRLFRIHVEMAIRGACTESSLILILMQPGAAVQEATQEKRAGFQYAHTTFGGFIWMHKEKQSGANSSPSIILRSTIT